MRKGELIVNYALLLGPLVLGLGVVWAMGLATFMPRATFLSMITLFLFGFILFAKAKLSVIKEGHFFSFGPARMSKQNRVAYYMGYGCMCLGLFLLIGFALAAR